MRYTQGERECPEYIQPPLSSPWSQPSTNLPWDSPRHSRSKALSVNAGKGGQYTLTYPALGTATETLLPSTVTINGRKLSARYSSGAAVTTELQDDGTMSFHFTALPDDVKKIRFDLPLPLTLNQGGSFAIDKRQAIAFPAAAAADAFLFKGDAKRLVVTPARGRCVCRRYRAWLAAGTGQPRLEYGHVRLDGDGRTSPHQRQRGLLHHSHCRAQRPAGQGRPR